MLVQISIVKKHITFRLQILIPACSSCLLHIIFQRIGYIKMNDQLYVGLVHTHSKRRGCDHYLYFIINKGVLIFLLFTLIHFSVKSKRRKSVITKFFCQFHSSFCSGNINNCRAVFLFNQPSERGIFFLITFFINDLVS